MVENAVAYTRGMGRAGRPLETLPGLRRSRPRLLAIALLALLTPTATAWAQAPDETLVFDGEVPDDGLDHFFIEFTVPEGIVEIEVRHDDLSAVNILDWGLDDPNGTRGWGGGNAEPAIVGLQAASRSYVAGPIPAGTWRVVVGKAKIAAPPGSYHVEIDLRTTATLAPQTDRAPYVPLPPVSAEARWYAGDFHVHSIESGDARPPIDEVVTFAKGRGLDFVELSDHNTVTQAEFIAAAQANAGEFLLLPGIEWTSYDGHANAIGAAQWVEHKLGQPGATIDAAADAVHAQGALFSINHPALDLGDSCIGCAWMHTLDGSKIDAVEIGTTGYDQAGKVFNAQAIAFWDGLCAQGFHVAAIGGSDDHKAGVDLGLFQSPIGDPTTMVYATELSAAGIVAGVRDARTVVKLQGPGDPMLELWSDHELDGDTVRSDDPVQVRAVVTDGAAYDLVWVVDGVAQPPIDVTSGTFEATWAIENPGVEETRVRAELRSGEVPRVVASHVWVSRCDGVDCSPLVDDGSGDDAGSSDGGGDGSGGSAGESGAPGGSDSGGSGDGSSGGCACSTHELGSTPRLDVLLWSMLGIAGLARVRRPRRLV